MIIKGFVRSEDFVDYQLWLNSNPVYSGSSVDAYYRLRKGQSKLSDF